MQIYEIRGKNRNQDHITGPFSLEKNLDIRSVTPLQL
jgi:hypothetical protein